MNATPKTSPTITIYSSPTCGYCYMVKEYLDQKGYKYTEKDISVDRQALEFVLSSVGQAVTPIIAIGKKVIIGFDRPNIDEALAGDEK